MADWTLKPIERGTYFTRMFEDSSALSDGITTLVGDGWKPLRIGAGGFITGISIAEDGTKVIRTDTYGGYIWDTDHWRQLVTVDSMPSPGIPPDGPSEGVYSIAVAPSDSDVIYMVYGGDLYKSTDGGLNFAATGFTHRSDLGPNDDYRTYGQKLAVDPADPDHVIAGTVSNGLFRSTDGGTNWAATSVTAGATAGHCGICFDASSALTGGRTSVIYAGSYGNGVWRSADAGATWTRISTTLTSVMNARCGNTSGVYYCSNGAPGSGTVNKYTGSWATNLGPTRVGGLAVDLADNTHVVGIWDAGNVEHSANSGSSWAASGQPSTRVATDIPWLAATNEAYMTSSDIVADPSVAGRYWFSQGIGVWYTDNIDAATVTWTSQSVGIEQLVASWIWSVPGGLPHVCAWDRPYFRVADPDVYPSGHGPNYDHAIIKGYSVEHATDDIDFLVVNACWGTNEESSYSEDGGLTWTAFTAYPPEEWKGGHIAVSTVLNWVWQENNKKPTYYTTNGGTTWTKISLPSPFVDDASDDGWGGIDGQVFLDRHVVCADRMTAGTFYLYHWVHGIFKTTNGGATWTRGRTTPLNHVNYDYWNGKLKAVPGQAGHLFWTCGQAGGGDPASGAGFWRSSDSGATFSQVSNVLEVYDFGFGKEKPGESYPAIFIIGFVSSVFGIWRSDDSCATWTKIGDYPLGSLDYAMCISGDENTYGRCYVGFKGSGWAYFG